MLFFDIWPWNVKDHWKVMKKLFDPDRESDCLAFCENRRLLSWLEPELSPFGNKMSGRIPWPKMTPISDHRGQKGLKLVCEVFLLGVACMPNLSEIEKGRCFSWSIWHGMTHMASKITHHAFVRRCTISTPRLSIVLSMKLSFDTTFTSQSAFNYDILSKNIQTY